MHQYSIDTTERRTIPFFIAVSAILSAWGLNSILEALSLAVPWWLEAPSVMGFYGLFYGLFDSRIWRWNFLHLIRIVKTPIISGDWEGTCVSSFNNTTHQVTISIKQTWTSMQVVLTTASSQSHSLVAGVTTETPVGPILSYQYQNDPRPGSHEDMQIHYGTAKLAIKMDLLEGEYYSGRGRQNIGTLSLKRVRR